MKRPAVWAASLTALVSIGLAGASTAAPIAALPNAVTQNTGNVLQAYYYHHHYYPYHWHHHYYGHRHWYGHHWRYW